MIRIGIIGENYQNDACAFEAFLTPQYKGKAEFIPLGKSLNGKLFAAKKIIQTISPLVKDKEIDAVIFMCDLDNESKRDTRNQWFATIQKGISFKSIFYLAVMELEALILADMDTFNGIYGINGQYSKNPKFESDPKQVLENRTNKTKRKYDENHATAIFTKLNFDIVYKRHKDEDSFQAFIDDFEAQFNINPTTKDRLKTTTGKGR